MRNVLHTELLSHHAERITYGAPVFTYGAQHYERITYEDMEVAVDRYHWWTAIKRVTASPPRKNASTYTLSLGSNGTALPKSFFSPGPALSSTARTSSRIFAVFFARISSAVENEKWCTRWETLVYLGNSTRNCVYHSPRRHHSSARLPLRPTTELKMS